MASTSTQRDDELTQSPSLKRKRTSNGSSTQEVFDFDENELNKYYKDPSTSQVEKPTTRKRKYLFKTDFVIPKKSRKFYFINEGMTKPRRPKITKPAKIEEKKLEPVPGKKCKLHFARSDGNGNIQLMHRLHLKSDLFFNDEKKCNYESFKKLDLAFHIVDEIALEGLDGITLEAFWKRLKYVFPNNISKSMADRIWRHICHNKRINFYVLKDPREKLIFCDRYKYLDVDSGMFLEPFIEFKDIYPLASINGIEIRGSCSTFHTRKENNGVRKFSMDKALKLYDQKLVFVADQTLRNKALINEEADPNIELLDVEYCMLEKIGRSRDQGEFTQGKMSLANDSKKVYHNRKVLSQNNLTVHQSFSLKSFALQQNMSGGLIHLSRFYHKRKTKQIAIMERIAQMLRKKPNYQIEFTEFRKIFGRNVSIVKLRKTTEFRKYFKILTFPYRKLYPNATPQEYLHKNKQKERQVRVLRMLDPHENITVLMEGKDVKDNIREEKDNSPGCKLINYEYLRDIFLYILSCEKTGATIHQIHDYFKTDFYSIRMAVRKLLMRNVISSSKIDLGRQQSLKFFAKCFNSPNCQIQTQPKTYQLSEDTLRRVLKGYDNIVQKIEFISEPETTSQMVPVETQFKLNFEPFCCTAFLTETVDPCCEELTICDIVIKGRDKLLLIESNLSTHYISEWDDYLLKRDDFSKGIQLFFNGFGKVIYDFLTTIRISDGFQVDNQIVFSMDSITADGNVGRQFNTHHTISIAKNYNSPHSDSRHFDTISKVYVFEAMFDEMHKSNQIIDKLKSVFERFMILNGKVKRIGTVAIKPETKIEVEVSNNVVMEKFMGSEPILEWCAQDEEVTTEIFASTKPKAIINSKTILVPNDVDLTQRYINRANLILKTVHERKIVPDVTTVYKDILKEEGEEGYDKKACKKSIVSIISKLVADGYIKCYKVVMTGKNATRTQCFICVHETDSQDSFIKSTIDQLKLKFYVVSSNTQKTITIKKKNSSPFSGIDVRESISELKQLTTFKSELNAKCDRTKGKEYGYAPKFVRMRVLHEHLFYVIREHTEREPIASRQVFDLCKNLKIKMTANEITEMPPIYRNEVSWKMFIPALPQHIKWPKGWTLACYIVLRMPLSVFVKLYNIAYDIPELQTYLNHPIKRHYLVKHLPVNIRNVLLHRRKYFHSIYETICNLCYVGLLQLGPRNFKEKDQLFLYLNARTSLYDTCSSKPGYNLIEKKKYKQTPVEFKTGSDVEIYWSEVLRICMNTPLGKRKVLDGQLVTIEDCALKPAMVETLKAKTFEQAVEQDDGKIPGDHRGSAGFDSSLWSFVKRNWMWNSQANKTSTIQSEVAELKKEKNESLPPPIQNDLVTQGGPPDRKIYLKSGKSNKKSTLTLSAIKKLKKKKIVRKIVAPRKKRVREYCDAIDRSIMKKNPGIRVEWTEEEDQLLRYCRVASVFLCPVFRKQFIPYNILRDVMHRIHPRSKDKTARAIQRRIYVLLINDETMKIMETKIENLLTSDTISKYFEQVYSRYKNGIKITDSQLSILFVYLMSYICKHRKEIELLLLGHFASFDFFSDANIADFETLLQSSDDGSNTVIYSSPKTVEDITQDTIKSIVHCSMACRKNSVGWTYQLSRIYKKFEDDLIRTSVSGLKKDQFFVQNKGSESKTIDNTWPAPIKFSHVYNLMKTASYTIEMFQHAYKNFVAVIGGKTEPDVVSFIDCNELNTFWEQSTFIFDVPEMGIILNTEIEDHSEVIEELAKRFRMYLEQIHQKTNIGKNKSVPLQVESSNSLEKNLDEIKDEVRHLIFRVPYLLEGNLEMYFKKMLDSNNSLEINNYIHLMVVDLKKFSLNFINVDAELKNFIGGIEENCVDDQQKLVKNLSKIVFAIQSMHQSLHNVETSFEENFKLWEVEVWDEVRTKNDEDGNCHKGLLNRNYASGMENCIKRVQEGDFPSLEEIKEGIMSEVENTENRKIPHITDLIMLLNEDRFPELDVDNETIEKMKGHFVMQYPKLKEFFIQNLEEIQNLPVTQNVLNGPKQDQVKNKLENKIKEPRLDSIMEYILDRNGIQNDIKVVEQLIDFVKGKKELGASGDELKKEFVERISFNLVELLEFLTQMNVFLRTGIASIVYVHFEYQAEWLTESFLLSPKEKEIFESGQDMKKNLRTLIGDKLQLSVPLKVQLKPWTKLDGSLNDNIFHDWLCLILSRCIDFPNIPFLILCEHFHYIKPVDIYSMLEVLQEIGCIVMYVLNRVQNSLFSKRCVMDECQATCLDSFEEMFVKPTNVSGLCFGSFLDVLE